MDSIDVLPRSSGFDVVIVVVDHLSKYVHFTPLKHPYTATTIAAVFVKWYVYIVYRVQ